MVLDEAAMSALPSCLARCAAAANLCRLPSVGCACWLRSPQVSDGQGQRPQRTAEEPGASDGHPGRCERD